MANQAIWRVDPKEGKGLGATFAYDWRPPNINRNNTMLTAGLRFNEPLPVNFHNTMSLGYVRNNQSSGYLQPGMPAYRAEQGVEFNTLLDVLPMFLIQTCGPVLCGRGEAARGVQSSSGSELRWSVKRG